MKKRIAVSVDDDIRYSLEGPVHEAVKLLQGFVDNNEELEDLRLDIETYTEYDGAICTISVVGYRMETDQEEARREQQEQEYAVKTRERKKQQLLALKKELGEL